MNHPVWLTALVLTISMSIVSLWCSSTALREVRDAHSLALENRSRIEGMEQREGKP